ncbi:hypothetical protein [Humibacillus xanthopallidus]|nr:hypothetical protein [Humibacillus xanthopallidus]
MDVPELYIQVWLRPDGHYQLEVRDGSLETHVQTRTVSRERTAKAFTEWLYEQSGDGDDGWRKNFQWNNISDSL